MISIIAMVIGVLVMRKSERKIRK